MLTLKDGCCALTVFENKSKSLMTHLFDHVLNSRIYIFTDSIIVRHDTVFNLSHSMNDATDGTGRGELVSRSGRVVSASASESVVHRLEYWRRHLVDA